MKFGCIYKITNTINSKVYIGQTVQDVRKRWYDHISQAYSNKCRTGKLQRAIIKYGRDSFTVEVLEDNLRKDELDAKEIAYIDQFNSYAEGYNTTSGGQRKSASKEHYIATKEHRANMSKSKRGKKLNWTPESLANVREAKLGTNNPNYGKKAERVICVYCGKDMAKNIYIQYHGKKCKLFDTRS